MRPRRVASPLLPALAVLVAIAAPARADITKDQCVDANTQAQSLRRDGKFTAARAQLLRCGDPTCPGIVRDDCAQRLDELERVQPTIVFDATDGAGRDLAAVSVTVDGQPLAGKLEGKALAVDPGAHTFVFTAAGAPPVSQSFVIREGEKDRRENIVVAALPAPAPPAPAQAAIVNGTAPAPAPARSSGLGAQRALGMGAAGLGVVGIGVGTVFGLLASSAWSKAKSACGGDIGHCADVSGADSYKSTTNTDGAVSTVAFVVGGALLAGGAVLFLTGAPHEHSAATVAVAPALAPGQGGFAVSGAF